MNGAIYCLSATSLHRPNLDAVRYFIDEIFPLVLDKIPTARFRIVGNDTPPEIFALSSENIIVEGFVSNIKPIFESCRVFVAPLRYGAGMKGKIGQALSFGLPTVTTSIGAEGMNLTDEREVLIADEPETFADAVVKLYQSAELWQRLSDNGFRFVEENFSPPVIDEKIQKAIEKISKAEISKAINLQMTKIRTSQNLSRKTKISFRRGTKQKEPTNRRRVF